MECPIGGLFLLQMLKVVAVTQFNLLFRKVTRLVTGMRKSVASSVAQTDSTCSTPNVTACEKPLVRTEARNASIGPSGVHHHQKSSHFHWPEKCTRKTDFLKCYLLTH